jgi:hypothetical protein
VTHETLDGFVIEQTNPIDKLLSQSFPALSKGQNILELTWDRVCVQLKTKHKVGVQQHLLPHLELPMTPFHISLHLHSILSWANCSFNRSEKCCLSSKVIATSVLSIVVLDGTAAMIESTPYKALKGEHFRAE